MVWGDVRGGTGVGGGARVFLVAFCRQAWAGGEESWEGGGVMESEERNLRAGVWGAALLAFVTVRVGPGDFGPVNVVPTVLGERFVFVCCGEKELLLLLLRLMMLSVMLF